MGRRFTVKAVVVAAASVLGMGASSARADFITEWVDVWLDTIRATGGPPCPISRNQAVLFTSIFEAVNSIDRGHQPYLNYVAVTTPASPRAAVAAAAHRVLVTLYPSRASIYDAQYQNQLNRLQFPTAKANGIAVGEAAAAAILADRANDQTNVVTPYTYVNVPGAYRPTPPDFTSPPFNPGWNLTKCWTMSTASQFRPTGPLGYSHLAPLLASAGYARQFNEVKALGERNSTVRTPEQTEIAWFWANDRNGTFKPPGHLIDVTRVVSNNERLSLVENARLFGLAALAMGDAGMVAWDQKYGTDIDLWRPITAIRQAGSDNNAATVRQGNWLPLLEFTPPFPAYTSGHATFGAAHAAVMRGYFGTDKKTFTIGTDEPIVSSVKRTFTSFSQAARENGLSRVYLGVHFRFDADSAYSSGTLLGNYVVKNHLRPIVCPADLNGDNVVDAVDAQLFSDAFFANDALADRNGDGVIDGEDFNVFSQDYLKGCGPQ